MDQSKGLEAKISKEEIRITILMDLQEVFQHLLETSLQGPTSHMRTITQTTEDLMINAQINHSIDMMEIDLEMDLLTTRMRTIKNNRNFSRSPSTQRRDFSQNNSYRQPKSSQPDNSTFRRCDNRSTTGFTPYEHKFPQSNNQTSSNVVAR